MGGHVLQKEKELSGETKERIHGVYKWVLILATSVAIFVGIYWAFWIKWFGLMEQNSYMYLLMSLLLPPVFWIYPARKRAAKGKISIYDIICSILSFSVLFYFFLQGWEIKTGGWTIVPPLEGYIGALILCILVLEASRRIAGLPFMVIVAVFAAYPLFAGFMPGILFGAQYSLKTTVSIHAYSITSILGLPMQVFTRILLGYLLFAVMLQVTGGGKFFLDMALALLGNVRGGIAKVAIASSGVMGSISGSAVANIMVTGSVTIPAMKRTGYAPHYAGAIETCASTGGQVMPPIMATTAFIMAEWIGMSYAKVAITAVLPAVIYYVSLMVQVDGYAVRHKLKGLPRAELPSLWESFKVGSVYIIAIAVLIYLMFAKLMLAQAPYIAICLMLLISMIRKETRLTLNVFFEALIALGKTLSMLVGVIAGVGLVLGGIVYTGIADSLGGELIYVVGGNVPLLIFSSALVCLIMGLGMTITPCYIMGALLLAPTIIRLGYPPLAVHFFILYYVNLCGLTPPVCVNAYAAAGLAEASPIKTAFTSVRVGSILFIIPIFFLLRPELLLLGTPADIIVAAGEALIGAIVIACAFEGYMIKVGRLSWVSRPLLGAGGLIIMFPGHIYALIAAVLIVGSIVLELVMRKAGTRLGAPKS